MSPPGDGDFRPFGEQLFFYRRRVEQRTAEPLSQAELGRRTGLTAVAISNLETGKHRAPLRGNVAALADALGLTGDERRGFTAAADATRKRKPRSTKEPTSALDHVPRYLTSFLGRDLDVETVLALLRRSRLVTLTGGPGVGKTRLAIEVVRRLQDDPSHQPVAFVDLSSLPSDASPINAIGAACGLRMNIQDSLPELVAAVKTRRLLLVLDNCEHLLEETRNVVGAMLQGSPHVTILTTSRDRLQMNGEQLHRLATLGCPQAATRLTREHIAKFPALALFVDRASAVQPSFSVSDETANLIGDVCRRVDGIPLAIEWIAGRMSSMTVTDMHRRFRSYFDEHLGFTAGSASDLPERHRTLRAAIGWSHDLLTLDERSVFRRLSIFSGGWTLEAAEAVCTEGTLSEAMVIEIVKSLVDKSLIVFESASPFARYRFLETTRTFAREMLEASGESHALGDRHLAWMTSVADQSDLDGWNEPIALWLPRLSAEFDNARSALSWARRKGEPRAAGIIAAAICRWGFACGLLGEARACAESELERGELDDHPDVAARLWSALGILTWGAQRVTFCERAAAVFRERGDRPRLAICAIRLGGGYHQTGDYGRAEAALREARAILREIGAERSAQAALALSWHATVLRTTNRLSEARDLLTDSIRIFERLGDEARAVGEKINLAELEFTAGDSQRAFALVREAIEGLRAADASGFQMSNSVQVQVTALHNAAAYAIALNDDQSASLYAREALLAARLSGGGTLTIPSIQHLATVAAMQRRTSTGARLCGYCDEALQRYEIVRELTEQRAYNKLVHLLFAQANELDIARWRLAGAAMTENEAIDLALSG